MKLKTFFLLFSNKQIFKNCIKEKIAQVVLFSCYVAVVVIPLFYSGNFNLKMFCWLIIGKNDKGDLLLNTPVIVFLPICIIVAADQIFNLKGRFFDRSKNLIQMLTKLSIEMPKVRRYCELGAKVAEATSSSNPKFAKKKLRECIYKTLKVFNGFISAFADTIDEKTIITSNIMVSLTKDDFATDQEYRTKTADFNLCDVYKSDTKDIENQLGWLTLLASCAESKKRYNLETFCMKLMPNHCDSLIGAPDAWHIGKNICDDIDFEYSFSYVNDVDSIEFNTNNKKFQAEATLHFKKLKFIKSFVSAPIIYSDNVVGVINVNSSDKVLAGINADQRAVLQLLISLFSQTISHCVMLWRRYEYDTTT
ncbi:MAG: GAF domain-containing protein [Fibrobacter sp.]|nr:GAF domain-containing protein [Fibrobacter sp.]